ncbi:ankyrin repeat domain-containing protein [Flavihumibacter petaseus]|uniref:Uncharacterized protein n=1 Tax=Flavihumibacter petaseus NBRC 106054 TaxID=1220578 RepID=A0A0E9N5H3_9BACT|nr:ankyrin repeat domain-containing protein [Flavihumibacter petaseus]GAO44931.1 hypothetical protein FPE01S_04_01740 [Flavihumibacter petaseus NBRC 106054]
MESAAALTRLLESAIAAIGNGDITTLQTLLSSHPELLEKRNITPREGYFAYPYLLWYIADNPIRNNGLPENILQITALLIKALTVAKVASRQEQLDYALGLVATGRIPKTANVQLAMIDLLIEAGAHPGTGIGALLNGNPEAATHLLNHGGKLTLATSLCLERPDDAAKLWNEATETDKQFALAAASYCGKADAIRFLISHGVGVNGFNPESAHPHSTPLHQAVASGSRESVSLLLQAGADTQVRDRIYDGKPVDWAIHLAHNAQSSAEKLNYQNIAQLLGESV